LRVKIIDSFGQAGATAVQRGCVLDVPELLARTWIRIHRAIAFPDASLPPQKIAEQPTSRPRSLETPARLKKAHR
jgi:hypothetical protein